MYSWPSEPASLQLSFLFFKVQTPLPIWYLLRGCPGKQCCMYPCRVCEDHEWAPLDTAVGLACVHAQAPGRVQLTANPKSAAHQAPPSMGLPSKKTGVGCHFFLWRIFLVQENDVDRGLVMEPMQGKLPSSQFDFGYTEQFCIGDKNLFIWISTIRGWLKNFFLVKFLRFWKFVMFPLKSMIDCDIVKWPSSPTQNKNSIQSI